MPYTLGAITLPKPKSFVRDIIEKGVENLLMFGRTTKRTENRKERFTLQYIYLTPAQIDSIISQYNLDMPLTFTVDEDNLSIPATEVLMDITGLNFPPSGEAWLENIKIVLTEVR